MELFEFNLHNSNVQITDNIKNVNYTYHINTFPFNIEHGHKDYWEFTIVTDGVIVNVVNGESDVYAKNTLFYSTTNDIHLLKKKSSAVRYINLVVRENTLRTVANGISADFFDKMVSANQKSIVLPDYVIAEIENTIHRINLLNNSDYRKYNDFLCSATILVLQQLFTHFIDVEQTTKAGWQNKLSELMRNKDFLTYNVDDLCELMDYSRMQLSRLFKKHYGVNPHRFLIDYKLQYAANLLRSTDIKVIEIASIVGYAKLSQFNVNFKQKYGVTPGNYRRGNEV